MPYGYVANGTGRPVYSHAAVYAGSGSVAEMLGGGLIVRPLRDTIADALVVDVYRHPTMTQEQGARVAANAAAYGRTRAVHYAVGQIITLLEAPYLFAPLVRDTAEEVDQYDEGREKMICSELVAWAYYDAGAEVRVKPWQAVLTDGIWTSLNRHMDYTTPNMLAQSPDLHFEYTLWPIR